MTVKYWHSSKGAKTILESYSISHYWTLSRHSLRDHLTTAMQDKASIKEFLANSYFSKATLSVEITKVRFGVKSTTARLITLAILMNGQPV